MKQKTKKQKNTKLLDRINRQAEKIKRLLVILVLVITPIYVLFAAFLYFNQANFFYYPDKRDFEKCDSFKDYQKTNSNGTRMYYQEKSKEEADHDK